MHLIDRVLDGRFEPSELEEVLERMLQGAMAPALAAGFLVALRTQPVTAELLVAGARVLRRRCVRVDGPPGRPIVDTCGTGGDGLDTVNLSTAAALLVAACDGTVAKQGGRAISGKCGSADIIEALGLRVELDPDDATEAMEETGFAFLMAPRFHVAIGNVAGIRRALGVRTLFNLLGPLTNPAFPDRQLVGVHDPALTEPMARALGELGCQRGLVVHCGGLDEIGLHAHTVGHLWDDGHIKPFHHPGAGVPLSALAGGDPARNARILREAFRGTRGPVADAISLNAGAALWLSDICPTFADGVAWARQRLAQGIRLADYRK